MPWLTILVTLLTFFISKKNGASTTRALGYAALAGGITYAYTHSDYAPPTLAQLDGVELSETVTTEGAVITDGSDQPVPNITLEDNSGVNPSWAEYIPLALAGTAGAVVGSTGSSTFWMWTTIGLAAFLLLKD